ncbi:MAG: zinc-binding dehydrogenase [Anaerolineae bacterium]|jgi:threonine dehydrogenase-like Zn-dependent dehydrogenase|nr:zinc-binding dehydrogenase [Anaerolineae bacterium]
MQAAVILRPGDLVVMDIPEPQVGDYDVLCELLYGATCTGTDQHLVAGRFPWPVSYPTVLGHESVGRVVAIGPKVRHFRAGDLVTRVGCPPSPDGSLAVNWGGFAELGIARDHWAMRADGLPAAAWRPHRINQIIPPEIDPRAATMIITWRETLSYVTRMGIASGATVLIIGSGGNGLAFAAHAAHAGAAQIVMLGSPRRQAAALAAGVTCYLGYAADDVATRLRDLSPDGFDFIIDAVGQAGSADRALPHLRPRGILGIYGIDDLAACRIAPHRARSSFTYYAGGYDEEETHQQVIDRMRDGRLDAWIWLDAEHTYPLDHILGAFDAVHSRRCIKALVQLTP